MGCKNPSLKDKIMTLFDEVRDSLETHKGRKLDLTKHRDLHLLKYAIQREFDKKQKIISNIREALQ
tara:strand:- start:8168 stop:8365 length:198 start_codon:yes stop_codon:yes gene_type:complete